MQAEIEMATGEVAELLLAVLRQLTDFPQGVVMTTADSLLKGFKPRVVLY